MIIVTGGSGFLGSHIIAEIEENALGPVVIVDDLSYPRKWKNIANRVIERFVEPRNLVEFMRWVGPLGAIRAVVHMGANSSTAETDAQKLIDANVTPFRHVWNLCVKYRLPLIYASSASVYGIDEACIDDDSVEALAALRPINAYAWSKKQCDLNAAMWARAERAPPWWCGLRFFNIYGPNEDHKANQKSFVTKAIRAGVDGSPLTIYPGPFARDWVYAHDVSSLVVYLLRAAAGEPLHDIPPSGVYNVGAGEARSFEEIGQIAERHFSVPIMWERGDIMPASMREGYQPRTCANVEKMRRAVPDWRARSLEAGMAHYIETYEHKGPKAYR